MREPDLVIGDDYLRRGYVIPRNNFFNIYLHNFKHSDDDRALHDHPWWSMSFLIKGSIEEIRDPKFHARKIIKYIPYLRRPTTAHRIVLLSDDAWTIFLTGWWVRDWGFHCPKGWVWWKDFCDISQGGTNKVGKGCD